MLKKVEMDVTGMICPTPIFEAEKEYIKLDSGDLLEIFTDSELIGFSLMDWAEGKGIEPDMVEGESGTWKVLIKVL